MIWKWRYIYYSQLFPRGNLARNEFFRQNSPFSHCCLFLKLVEFFNHAFKFEEEARVVHWLSLLMFISSRVLPMAMLGSLLRCVCCCILISTAERAAGSCRQLLGGINFRFCSPSANDSFGRLLLAQAKKPSVERLWMAGCWRAVNGRMFWASWMSLDKVSAPASGVWGSYP